MGHDIPPRPRDLLQKTQNATIEFLKIDKSKFIIDGSIVCRVLKDEKRVP